MSIKPENRSLYPPDWAERVRVLRERAGARCEFCSVADRVWIQRHSEHPWMWRACPTEADEIGWPWRPRIMVICTGAHRDHALVDHHLRNLVYLCQRCHLLYDRGFHWRSGERMSEAV